MDFINNLLESPYYFYYDVQLEKGIGFGNEVKSLLDDASGFYNNVVEELVSPDEIIENTLSILEQNPFMTPALKIVLRLNKKQYDFVKDFCGRFGIDFLNLVRETANDDFENSDEYEAYDNLSMTCSINTADRWADYNLDTVKDIIADYKEKIKETYIFYRINPEEEYDIVGGACYDDEEDIAEIEKIAYKHFNYHNESVELEGVMIGLTSNESSNTIDKSIDCISSDPDRVSQLFLEIFSDTAHMFFGTRRDEYSAGIPGIDSYINQRQLDELSDAYVIPPDETILFKYGGNTWGFVLTNKSFLWKFERYDYTKKQRAAVSLNQIKEITYKNKQLQVICNNGEKSDYITLHSESFSSQENFYKRLCQFLAAIGTVNEDFLKDESIFDFLSKYKASEDTIEFFNDYYDSFQNKVFLP